MTVTTTNNTVKYTGDGSLAIFPFDFMVFDEAHMYAVLGIDPETNILTTLNPDQIAVPGGTVTFLDGPPDINIPITLYRLVPVDQLIDYTPYDDFPAETHERGLDKLTMLSQQNAERVLNALQVPVGDSGRVLLPNLDVRKLKYVFFDENGDVTVSDGTAVGGEGLKGIRITNDSRTMLLVDNTDLEYPAIGVNNINAAGGLMKLTQFGDYPNIPSGGLPPEVIARTPALVTAIVIDDGTVQGGDPLIDSQAMLSITRQIVEDPDTGIIGIAAIIQVDRPNLANSLVQVEPSGLIPQNLTAFVGLRNLGPFRGDNLCDKVGDGVGDCIFPDYRNPSDRDTGLITFETGDFKAITIRAGEELADNRISLYVDDGLGNFVLEDTPVKANDGITYVGQEVNDVQPNIPVGWYHQPDRFNLTLAILVPLDNTSYVFIIGPPEGLPDADNVQVAMDILDKKLGELDSAQVAHVHPAGEIIDSNTVREAIDQLDAGALPRSGGAMSGQIEIIDPLDPLRKRSYDYNYNYTQVEQNNTPGEVFAMGSYMNSAVGSYDMEMYNETGHTGTFQFTTSGNIVAFASLPVNSNHLTRKDYVDDSTVSITGDTMTGDLAINRGEDHQVNIYNAGQWLGIDSRRVGAARPQAYMEFDYDVQGDDLPHVTIGIRAQNGDQLASFGFHPDGTLNVAGSPVKREQDFLLTGDRLDIFNVRED